MSKLSALGVLDADNSSSRLEIVENLGRFAEVAGAWERLAEREPTPFCSHSWFSAWWNAFGEDGQLRVVLLWDAEDLAAVYPLYLGGGLCRAMTNVHSPLFSPLARDSAALRRVSEAALHLGSSRLVVGPLAVQDAALLGLERGADECGAHVLRSALHVSPIVDTGGDFDAWRAGSRPRWGAPLERFRRKMLRENDAEIRVVRAPEDLEVELVRGFAVEASGWKGSSGTAILSSPSTERFYTQVAHAATARDELRLSTIALDGEIAAFDLTLLRDGRLYLLKTGFDERWRRLAPGLVMRLSVIERCFELGLTAHELLGDDSEWKRKFSTSSRAHVAVDVYGRHPRELAAYAWRGSIRPRLARGRARARGLIARGSR